MALLLWVKEIFVNATEHYRFGEAEPYETDCLTIGELYRAMGREYGRCTGKMYVEHAEGDRQRGWVFLKRMRYEDSPRGETYLRETWVTVLDGPDNVTVDRKYHEFHV